MSSKTDDSSLVYSVHAISNYQRKQIYQSRHEPEKYSVIHNINKESTNQWFFVINDFFSQKYLKKRKL